MKYLSTLLAASIVSVSLAAAPATASAQAANSFITFGSLDWAWASPCASGIGGSCGADVDLTLGWRFATPDEWLTRPEASDFLDAGGNYAGANGQMRCASYFFGSGYSHCDYFNSFDGAQVDDLVMSGPGVGAQVGHAETWLVRRAVSAVPEPGTYAMVAAGLAGIFGIARRRRSYHGARQVALGVICGGASAG